MVVLEAPTLFETKVLTWMCHPIIVVSISDESLQLKRLMARNKDLTKEQAENKIKAQMPLKMKKERADILLENSQGEKELEQRIASKTLPDVIRELKLDLR